VADGRASAWRAWVAAKQASWLGTLDAIVVLDAPDGVLDDRICGRDKAHRLKALAVEERLAGIARWRATLAPVIAAAERAVPERVLRLDTAHRSAASVADAILGSLEASGGHGGRLLHRGVPHVP
jgi:hypothetical protein